MLDDNNTEVIGIYQTERPNAICVVVTHVDRNPIDHDEHWFPKSETDFDDKYPHSRGEEVEFLVADWILEKRSLI